VARIIQNRLAPLNTASSAGAFCGWSGELGGGIDMLSVNK
jgi:hypothetical protein